MIGFRSGLARMLSLVLIAVGGQVAAQETNEIFLDATYLGAPTEWCPSDAGVPVVFKMDGPDIIRSPSDWPSTVRVRRGGQISVIVSEENVISLQRPRDAFDPKVIGRFFAEFQACQDPWSSPHVQGRWRLKASNGSELDTGNMDAVSLGYFRLPFFQSARGLAGLYYAKFGDRVFFTANLPDVKRSQSFAAGKDKG